MDASGASPVHAGASPFDQHAAFELGKDASHLKHGASRGGSRIEPLLVNKEVDLEGAQLLHQGDKASERAAEPGNIPGHQHVELAARSVLQHGCILCPPLGPDGA